MTKIRKLPWLIAGMLLFSTLINYTARLTLSVVVGKVLREFSMTERDYAQIVSLFLVAYAVMYAGSGYVVDRLGTRRGFALFVSAWSSFQVLTGFVQGKWSLAAAQFGLGLAEPGNFPAGVKTVNEWFPADQRAAGIGLFNAGSSLGAAVGVPVAAFFAVKYGWRTAFFYTGASGFVWVILWSIIYPPRGSRRWISARRDNHLVDPKGASPVPTAESGSKPDVLALLRSRQCLILILTRFFTDPVAYFIIFWLPRYLEKERGFDTAMVGKYGWIPFFVGSTGFIFGGWLSGQLMRTGWSLPKARKATMLLGACLLPLAILAPAAPTAGIAIAAICFLGFGHAVWVTNLLTLPADLFGKNEVGTATGLSGAGGGISAVLATLGTGYIVTRFSYKPVFVMAGLLHPMSIALIFTGLPDRDFRQARRTELSTV